MVFDAMFPAHRTDAPHGLFFCLGWHHASKMERYSALAPEAVDCRESQPDWQPVYDRFVAKLRENGVGFGAPRIGESFPEFALPDSRGRYRSLQSFLAKGPVVLSFNRGGWCPYCQREIAAWRAKEAELNKAGGHLVIIAAEVGGRTSELHNMIGPAADVLCDVDHGVALSTGLAFRCDDDLKSRYLACGLDLAEIYGGNSWIMPVPATFVLDEAGVVRFAFVDPDFRIRAEPTDVIEEISRITR